MVQFTVSNSYKLHNNFAAGRMIQHYMIKIGHILKQLAIQMRSEEIL